MAPELPPGAIRREKQWPILLARLGEEGRYASIGPLALTGFADHVGVNQEHDLWLQLKTSGMEAKSSANGRRRGVSQAAAGMARSS